MTDESKRSPASRRVRWLIVAVALLVCLAYIALTFDWPAIGAVLRRADLAVFLAGGCATIVAYFVLRTLRWSFVLRAVGLRPGFGALYRWCVLSQAAIVVTPFQSGEVVKVEMLHGAGHGERAGGYGGLVVERIADVAVLAVIGGVSIALRFEWLGASARALAIVAALALAFLAVAAFLARKRLGFLTEMARSAFGVARQPAVLVPVVLLTIGSWSVVALGWLVTLRSIGVDVSFAQSLGLVSVVTLVNVASLIPGAIGISEVGITESLVRLGYETSLAQAGALLIRAYALEVLALAAIHVVVWRVADRRAARNVTTT